MTYDIYMDIRRNHGFMRVMITIYLYLLDSTIAILKIPVMSYDCEYAMKQVKNLFPFQLYCVRSFVVKSYRIGKSL